MNGKLNDAIIKDRTEKFWQSSKSLTMKLATAPPSSFVKPLLHTSDDRGNAYDFLIDGSFLICFCHHWSNQPCQPFAHRLQFCKGEKLMKQKQLNAIGGGAENVDWIGVGGRRRYSMGRRYDYSYLNIVESQILCWRRK